jgi:hypothetical protein
MSNCSTRAQIDAVNKDCWYVCEDAKRAESVMKQLRRAKIDLFAGYGAEAGGSSWTTIHLHLRRITDEL